MKSVQRILSTGAVLATVAGYVLSFGLLRGAGQEVFCSYTEGTGHPAQDCKRASRAPQNRCVLPAGSSTSDSECQGAFGVGRDLPKEASFRRNGVKHGDAFGQGASHCEKFAQLATEQAKEAEALAVLHEDMAKEAEQKQQ